MGDCLLISGREQRDEVYIWLVVDLAYPKISRSIVRNCFMASLLLRLWR